MISEVLPYLILITCILIRVSSKEVKWTVLDTSPKLGQGLTLFCEVDNCAVHETKRWHGGPDKKPLMSNSGISTDKTKYSTSIVQNGFILTILNLTVKDLNISYTCSCGLDLDKHILYIEDIYTVDNLNKSTNGTNYVGTNDATGIILKIILPLLLVIILFVVFIVVMKKLGGLKRLKEMFCGSRIKKPDEDGNKKVKELLLHDVDVESNQRRSLDEDGNKKVTESLLHDDDIESNHRRSLDEDGNKKVTESLLHDDDVESNHRRSLDEEGNEKVAESLVHDVDVESNQRRSLEPDILNPWKKDFDMFVSTRASAHVFDCLKANPSVTVVGNPGVGKTVTMRYVALKMQRIGYIVFPTCKAEDITKCSKEGKKTLFVIDNICGQYTVDPYSISRWQEMSEDIQQLLNNKYCKIISTCRLLIFNDDKFISLPFFKSCVCDLNSQDLCVTSVERLKIAQKYVEDKGSGK